MMTKKEFLALHMPMPQPGEVVTTTLRMVTVEQRSALHDRPFSSFTESEVRLFLEASAAMLARLLDAIPHAENAEHLRLIAFNVKGVLRQLEAAGARLDDLYCERDGLPTQ